MTRTDATSELMLCQDGPILVRGPVDVEDEGGVVHHSERPVVALCRCGASSAPPWCDGSHSSLRRADRSPRRPVGGSSGARDLDDPDAADPDGLAEY